MPEQEDSVYRVETRYLNIAKIMFLSSGANGQDPDDFAEDIAAKIEELTEEIVDFNLEVYPLEGGYISHAIEGAELIPKKTSKNRFRKQIFEEWDHRCAYCDKTADTLDHVIPKGSVMDQNRIGTTKNGTEISRSGIKPAQMLLNTGCRTEPWINNTAHKSAPATCLTSTGKSLRPWSTSDNTAPPCAYHIAFRCTPRSRIRLFQSAQNAEH